MRVGYRELLVWYDVDYDRGFWEGNGDKMEIFLLEDVLDREGIGLALIYMGLIDVG